ncbi:MAG: TIGR04282 family arsenosugar biosynthesis glycosyltransferase [Verrucomicrobiales bacterium]|nr:TIGR04282 family arsenosugar biosynthesis glycosyltransferase [Verrucomicrobiales bacterium]
METLVMVFLKFPEPGKVKTRLGAEVGNEESARIYRELVRCVLGRIPEGQRVRVVFDPVDREVEVRVWLDGLLEKVGEVDFRAQVGGDLGERMEAAFVEAFADGAERVVVVGTDCVDLGQAEYGDAWRLLASGHDVVFGVARDGGYYLLGLGRPVAGLFRGIPWSSERTLAASFDAASHAGLVVGLLRPLSDVDTLADWESVKGRL